MGNRPRIAKPNAQQKARTAVRELYSDVIDNLSNTECDLVIKARIDGLGTIFIVDLITKRRESHKANQLAWEQYHAQKKQSV
jgi:hypothetical protein